MSDASRIFYAAYTVGGDAGQEPRDGFFVSAGIKPADTRVMRRVCLQMAMITKTGLDYFMKLPVTELLELVKELNDIGKKQRV